MPPYLKLGAALGALLSFHGAPVMAQAAGGETLTLERVFASPDLAGPQPRALSLANPAEFCYEFCTIGRAVLLRPEHPSYPCTSWPRKSPRARAARGASLLLPIGAHSPLPR